MVCAPMPAAYGAPETCHDTSLLAMGLQPIRSLKRRYAKGIRGVYIIRSKCAIQSQHRPRKHRHIQPKRLNRKIRTNSYFMIYIIYRFLSTLYMCLQNAFEKTSGVSGNVQTRRMYSIGASSASFSGIPPYIGSLAI